MAPHRRELRAMTGYDGVPAGPLGPPDTWGNDSSTAETPRPQPSREPELAPARESSDQRLAGAGGQASSLSDYR